MARKDRILSSFLSHPLIMEKYGILGPLPNSVREAKDSNEPIVAAIARIVDATESPSNTSEAGLYNLINKYLNTCAL